MMSSFCTWLLVGGASLFPAGVHALSKKEDKDSNKMPVWAIVGLSILVVGAILLLLFMFCGRKRGSAGSRAAGGAERRGGEGTLMAGKRRGRGGDGSSESEGARW